MAEAQQRASMQDYRNFLLYLTAPLWNMLEGGDATVSQLRKIEVVCTHLVNQLGLRHASEPTQSVLVALFGRRLDALQQSALLQTIKSVLRTTTMRARQVGTPLPGNHYLLRLPAGQAELPDAFRAHVATLGITPAPPGVNLEEIWQAARATPLRSRNQQLVLQQAAQGRAGQGMTPVMQTMALQQQVATQVATQTAAMMATALAGALGHREMEAPLRNLEIFGRPAATATPRSSALEQLMERAETVSSNVASSASAGAAASTPLLALANGSVETVPERTTSRTAATPVPGATVDTPGCVAVPVPEGTSMTLPSSRVLNAGHAGCAAFPSVVATAVAEGDQEPPATEIPSKVAESVQKLANAHYQKVLPEESLEKVSKGKGRGKGRVRALKKPAASKAFMKKPGAASAASAGVSQEGKEHDEPVRAAIAGRAMKRPASAAGCQSSKKRPAAAGSAVVDLKPLSEKERFKLQPDGCSGCRGRPGCCRSCWAKRGFLVKQMTLQTFRGVFTKKLADGTVQLRLGDRREKWTKIRCRTLEDHWRSQAAAAAAPVTPPINVTASADAPPVLVRWRAKVLTHVREAIRKVQENAAEWGYPLEEFPVLEELLEMQLRLRTDAALPPNEAHACIRKAKVYLYMAELSSDSD
eukprot:s1875_g5.t1